MSRLVLICLVLGILLIYLIYDSIKKQPMLHEGFASSKLNNKHKRGKKYDANYDIKMYGLDGNTSRSGFSDIEKRQKGNGNKSKLSKLSKFSKKGKRDEFKDVIAEIDQINPGAFSFKSIGNTMKRYNNNLDSRLRYAKDSNNHSKLDGTMAQGSVLFDEFKKLFAFSDMF